MTPPESVQAMLADIAAHAREAADFTRHPQISPRVLEAMARVPREAFVPEGLRGRAYWDSPLPIGEGQTISQPFIVALMTDLVRPHPRARVLDVGTGSGYQAAVLAELVDRVHSLEVVPRLAREAGERLRDLGYGNVETRAGDGRRGWPEAAPFDGIVVAAAADEVPGALVEQLRPGGRLVIPVKGGPYAQNLLLIEKGDDGGLDVREVLPVAFVPLVGG